MEHVGIVVDDLPAAIEFFVELGLEPRGKAQVESPWVERIIALDEVRVEFAWLRTQDGHGEIELGEVPLAVGELVRYEDSYWLCYVRGPEGIIVELAEKIR
jgi:catechol 2,3-dioxygenase-like lactoylglutathione lyase family enzyme